jgi:hypothetical protein
VGKSNGALFLHDFDGCPAQDFVQKKLNKRELILAIHILDAK